MVTEGFFLLQCKDEAPKVIGSNLFEVYIATEEVTEIPNSIGYPGYSPRGFAFSFRADSVGSQRIRESNHFKLRTLTA